MLVANPDLQLVTELGSSLYELIDALQICEEMRSVGCLGR